jgi:hypothetical protein
MGAIKSAADLFAKYDRPKWSISHPFSKKPDGQIGASDTSLSFKGADRGAAFVRDLSELSDADFATAIAKMDEKALKLYVYNKYPEFFIKWDNGKMPDGVRVWQLSAMQGQVDRYELRAGGGIDRLIADLDRFITEPRDRALFGKFELVTRRLDDAMLRAAASRMHSGGYDRFGY